jgi:cytochrome c peroxidase
VRYRAAAAAAVLAAGAAAADAPPALDAAEVARIVALGPWTGPATPAATEPLQALGERLFHSAQLAGAGGVRCASCHQPWRAYADGRARTMGVAEGMRNAPTLLNVGRHRVFGWDGALASLAEQSVRPLLDAREMASSPQRVGALLRGDTELAALYRAAFGGPPGDDDGRVLADAGRALARFQLTLVSGRTRFDDFRDALARGEADRRYPPDAQRGLRLFVGRGGCLACHAGAAFSDDALHRSAIESAPTAGLPTDRAHDGSNRFRTPGLREVAATGPYMHDGSVAGLCDAVRPHTVPAAPALDADERTDVVAFLRTLGAPPADADAGAERCR